MLSHSLVALINCQVTVSSRSGCRKWGTYELSLQPNHFLFNEMKKRSGARIIQGWKQRECIEAAGADAALFFRSESIGLKNLT